MKPVSKTAFYCAGVRMQDAERARPICNDTYAKQFMDEAALRLFEDFEKFERPNRGNVVRHAIIDDLLRTRLARDPDATIVSIGCGFDSRAFRLPGGRWFEIDEPALIAYKDDRLSSAESPNPLTRIPVDFARDAMRDKLPPVQDTDNIIVVVEGVLIYLPPEEIQQLIDTLGEVFPKHHLIADLMERQFIETYAGPIHQKIAELGARFQFLTDRPEDLFERRGYRVTETVPIVRKTVGLGPPVLRTISQWIMPNSLLNGYRVNVFTRAG